MRSKSLTAIEHPELALVRSVDRIDVPSDLIEKQKSLSASIALCIQLSGLEEKEVYMTLGIDAGHWTRIMKGDAHFPVNKLGNLMDLCGNEAPLLWLSRSRGYALVMIKTEAERRAEEAELKLRAAEAENRLMRELLGGRAA